MSKADCVWDVGPFMLILLDAEDRAQERAEGDRTRPFWLRCGWGLAFGIGGPWGCFEVEIKRP